MKKNKKVRINILALVSLILFVVCGIDVLRVAFKLATSLSCMTIDGLYITLIELLILNITGRILYERA